MQVNETKNEALKREFTVRIEADAINQQTEAQLTAMSKNLKIDGFRAGHVPMKVLKKRFGKNVLGEVIERSVNDSSQKVMQERNIVPAMPPKIEITAYEEGGALDYRMELEVLPEVKEVDFSKIAIEKLSYDSDEKEIDEAIGRLADRNKSFKAVSGAKAKLGHRLLIDFVGKMDGVAFEGGTAEKVGLELGSGSFIAGFEDQLVGSQEGSDVTVKVTFPDTYHKQELAGKPAEFAVRVHEVQEGEKPAVDDAFAQKMGFADLAALKAAIASQLSGNYDASVRVKVKKQLFDALDKEAAFAVPECMLEAEFGAIWGKVVQAKKEGDEALQGKTDEQLQEEYKKIAERRVRLGILLSDVALKNKLQVSQEEITRGVMEQARQFPGQEKAVFEFYRKNPQSLQELRGPILEEKAVDFILEKAKITERKVSIEELMAEDSEQGAEEEAAPKKKKAARS